MRPTTNVKTMPEMALKREVLGWLIAARSGHGHFADYHEIFSHNEQVYTLRVVNDSHNFTPFPARRQDRTKRNCGVKR